MVDFAVKIGGFGGELVCNVEDERHSHVAGWKTVQDAAATRSFERLRIDMSTHRSRLQLQPKAPMWLAAINLAHHALGDRSVRALVDALVAGSCRVGTIELYKNQLGDAAAQALSVLIRRSPAPGVHGMHLSHNYFTPLGVELLISAAAECGHYPRRRPKDPEDKGRSPDTFAPLWLRVECQQCPWPLLTGACPVTQVRKALQLLEQKEGTLITRAQRKGVLTKETLPKGFRMTCVPRCSSSFQVDDTVYGQAGKTIFDELPINCNAQRCCRATEHGPVVHLPYFWSQNGRLNKDAVPALASLYKQDPNWKNWQPRRHIDVQIRAPKPIADIPAEPVADGPPQPGQFSVGDNVVDKECRLGTVVWDGRAKGFNFAKVKWADTGAHSGILDPESLTRHVALDAAPDTGEVLQSKPSLTTTTGLASQEQPTELLLEEPLDGFAGLAGPDGNLASLAARVSNAPTSEVSPAAYAASSAPQLAPKAESASPAPKRSRGRPKTEASPASSAAARTPKRAKTEIAPVATPPPVLALPADVLARQKEASKLPAFKKNLRQHGNLVFTYPVDLD